MTMLLSIALIAALGLAVWLWFERKTALNTASEKTREAGRAAVRLAEAQNARTDLQAQLDALARYREIADTEGVAAAMMAKAEVNSRALRATAEAESAAVLLRAKLEYEATQKNALELIKKTRADAAQQLEAAQKSVSDARAQAALVIEEAHQRAREIGGNAYAAMERAHELEATAVAMKGLIDGYGDAYIVPTFSLIDELAGNFGHVEAGANLKRAREVTRTMVRAGRAAACDYVEAGRRDTAVRFITDAFNGKVDSILSRIKSENHGKLEQEIRGAFHLVNHNGAAFRNARISQEYLDSRLEELRWAATAQALQNQEREEQRRIREQIREEERARREYERALKEAASEENAIKKAMERVQAQVAQANEAQRAAFEEKLRDLHEKLLAAEEKGRRALSMAQQTKVGHVYVISNIGSFGESVFKIGMTRRLEPTDRVRELGDASVPFEFDIHAMIYSEDAPALERSLHLHFMRAQLNKVNPRKEFFRLGLESIRQHVDSLGINAHWTLTARAHDYRESLRIEQQLDTSPELAREWTQHQVAAELAADEVVEAVEV